MTQEFASGSGLFGGTAPGTVDPFSLAGVSMATGTATEAMHNRYKQLGLSGSPQGGTPASAAAGGTNLSYGGPSTMEGMDLGQIPSTSGGIPGMEAALMGELQNASPGQSGSSGGGGKGGGGGGLGGIGGIASLAGGK